MRRYILVYVGIWFGLLSGSCTVLNVSRLTSEPYVEKQNAVRELIIRYYTVVGSLHVIMYGDPSRVITGPMLESVSSIDRTAFDRNSFYVIDMLNINEVHVLEYSPSKIKAIGCGKISLKVVNANGKIQETLLPQSLMNVFVFVRESTTWKLSAAHTFRDPKSDLISFASDDPEKKEAIGDLQEYIDLYFPCG